MERISYVYLMRFLVSMKTSIEISKLVIDVILNSPYTLFFTPYYNFNLIKIDPDDNKYVDCAVVANARFIVTEDHHFQILKQYNFPKVDFIGLEAFYHSL